MAFGWFSAESGRVEEPLELRPKEKRAGPAPAAPTAPSIPPAPARGLLPGDFVGSYELVRLVGEGGMARVFQARHRRLGRVVALKILRPEHRRSTDFVRRFFEEARAVNEINHPHIVQICDFVEEPGDGLCYCVMEFLRGRTLADALAAGPLKVAAIREIGRQVADAAAAAHAVGVVHRDLKPANILLVEGPAVEVKLLDFGIAKLCLPLGEVNPRQTAQGLVLGTPTYMAPEQAQGLTIDARADIYSFGVVLYEALAGHPPFLGEAFAALAAEILREPAPPLPARSSSGEPIPSQLSDLVMHCLAKAPDGRPASMEAVLGALWNIPNRRPRGIAMRFAAAAAGVAALGIALGMARSERMHPVAAAVEAMLPVATAAVDPPGPPPGGRAETALARVPLFPPASPPDPTDWRTRPQVAPLPEVPPPPAALARHPRARADGRPEARTEADPAPPPFPKSPPQDRDGLFDPFAE